ncbi:MAG: hypothetical protein EKK62_02525, partial [Acidimicrobiia bacterium]
MTDFTAPQNPTAAGTAAPTAGPAPGAPTDPSFDGGPRTRPTGPPTPWGRPEVTEWLVARRNAGATPAVIATELVARGWDADAAA